MRLFPALCQGQGPSRVPLLQVHGELDNRSLRAVPCIVLYNAPTSAESQSPVTAQTESHTTSSALAPAPPDLLWESTKP